MTSATPTPADVVEKVDALGPPGTPVTTPEVADGFDCTQRTIYNRLESLVEDGVLQTKKAGANSRVWWRSVDGPLRENGGDADRPHAVSPRDGRSASFSSDGAITERQRAELENEAVSERLKSELVESEARFRNVFKNDMVPMAVWTDDGRIRDANEAFLDLLGYTREELDAGEIDWTDRTPPEYRQRDEDAVADVKETGSCDPYEKEFIHKDGHPIPVVIGGGEFDDCRDQGILFAVDITERKEAERQLRESQSRLEAELETTRQLHEVSIQSIEEDDGDLLYDAALETAIDLLNADFGSLQRLDADANELELLTYRGFSREAADLWERVGVESSGSCSRALKTGERVVVPDRETCEWMSDSEDLEMFRKTGIRAVQTTPLVSRNGEVLGMISTHWADTHELHERDRHVLDVLARQVTDVFQQRSAFEALRESEAALERLNAATRELLETELETIGGRIAPLVREVLDVEYAAFWQYDDQSGDLGEHAVDTATDVDVEAVEFSTDVADQVWETFVGTDVDVENDLDLGSDVASAVRSRAFVPLGRHGVVCLASTEPHGFDGRTVDLVETVAASVETAWDRADSEANLARQNEELSRLNRLNTLIRRLDQALLGADTREAIEDAVCEQLASSDLFEAAWLATYDAGADALRPVAWAGVDSRHLEDRTVAVGDGLSDDPLVTAHRTREMQVVPDIAVDARADSWREDALERGARSCITIPLVYEESMYGIFTVYGSTPQPDDRETDVLVELGGTIAHAINAVETRETLQTDSVVELTLRTAGASTPLCRLARRLDCSIDFEGLVPAGDDATVFFTVSDVPTADVLAVAEAPSAFEDLTCLVESEDDGSALFRTTVTEPTIASLLVEGNAVVRSLAIDSTAGTAVVDVFRADHVGAFLDTLRESLPELELLARRTQSRPLETRETFRQKIEDRLTPRQHEVLLTAYRSGFFQSPRPQTGTELADVLDISPPTFTHHLRGAERRLCEMVFDTTA